MDAVGVYVDGRGQAAAADSQMYMFLRVEELSTGIRSVLSELTYTMSRRHCIQAVISSREQYKSGRSLKGRPSFQAKACSNGEGLGTVSPVHAPRCQSSHSSQCSRGHHSTWLAPISVFSGVISSPAHPPTTPGTSPHTRRPAPTPPEPCKPSPSWPASHSSCSHPPLLNSTGTPRQALCGLDRAT